MKTPALAPMHRRLSSRFGRRVDGFTLLEVLVAIVVLSFGVLGVVGLQAAALQSNKEARYQSTAVALGRELADMMRGNKDVALATTSAANPYLGSFASTGTLPTAAENCFTATCTTQLSVAQFGMREWLTRVRATLPDARVDVCFDDEPYDGTGRPVWACNSAANGAVVLKISWARRSVDIQDPTLEAGAAARPAVILPLIAGSAT